MKSVGHITESPWLHKRKFLGGGKGEITRYYLLQGLQVLAHKVLADDYIEDNQITEDELQEMYRAAFLMV